MITPQELRAAMAKADEEILRELETAIDATLQKDWVSETSKVVFLLVGAYPRRVVEQTMDKYKRKGWAVVYGNGQQGLQEDSLTFSEAPAAQKITCRCPTGCHMRGCDHASTVRNPQ
jgi:hypothetical protein